MKQFENNILCKYCRGCNRLELESFNGVMNCRGFVQGCDMTEFYNKLKEVKTK